MYPFSSLDSPKAEPKIKDFRRWSQGAGMREAGECIREKEKANEGCITDLPFQVTGSIPLRTSEQLSKIPLKLSLWEIPWWRSGWESACQCRGHEFKPWSGKIPHAAEQLGPWAKTTEPAHLEPVLRNKRGHDSERPAHRDEEWPPLAATRESPRTEMKTQHSQK